MQLITRKEAKALNLTTYFTGNPCVHGHISLRKVGNGVCTVCAALLTRRWREEGKKSEIFRVNSLPTVEYLRECFSVVNNVLVWNTRPLHHYDTLRGYRQHLTMFAGKLAGYRNTRNHYLEVRLDGRLYKGHRLIYKLLTGIEPTLMLDHIDGDVTNDRIENLREANAQENSRNAKPRRNKVLSKYKGVISKNGLWYSSVTVTDVTELILADSEESAARDYDSRAKELFGEFYSPNFKQT